MPMPPRTVRPAISSGQRTLRNINLTLHVGALMVVAASLLLIGILFRAIIKMAGAALLIVGFYAGGLLLYAKRSRLRPAAVAFTGTGRALIPITVPAHYTLLIQNPVVC